MEINRQDITIFVVDDEFVIRDSLSLLIESAGLKVETYDSAITFLEQVDINQPGCLVLDMRIPDMDGLELQEELVKRNCTMPIIFMSGHADIEISSKAFRAGAIDFIEKPFDTKLLLQRIEEMVEQILLSWPENQKRQQLYQRYLLLTPREKEVFFLTVHNHSNKQAAKKLNISNRTIDVHRAHIMEKMQALISTLKTFVQLIV
jgi:FixJ family two-component response regulator